MIHSQRCNNTFGLSLQLLTETCPQLRKGPMMSMLVSSLSVEGIWFTFLFLFAVDLTMRFHKLSFNFFIDFAQHYQHQLTSLSISFEDNDFYIREDNLLVPYLVYPTDDMQAQQSH